MKLPRIGHGTFRLANSVCMSNEFIRNAMTNPILASIESGLCSYIDTAPNYGDGSAVSF